MGDRAEDFRKAGKQNAFIAPRMNEDEAYNLVTNQGNSIPVSEGNVLRLVGPQDGDGAMRVIQSDPSPIVDRDGTLVGTVVELQREMPIDVAQFPVARQIHTLLRGGRATIRTEELLRAEARRQRQELLRAAASGPPRGEATELGLYGPDQGEAHGGGGGGPIRQAGGRGGFGQ